MRSRGGRVLDHAGGSQFRKRSLVGNDRIAAELEKVRPRSHSRAPPVRWRGRGATARTAACGAEHW